MNKKVISIVVAILLLGGSLFYIYQTKLRPQLGEYRNPTKEEVIRFYNENKDSLEYIQQTTAVIDNSFRIRPNGYADCNCKGMGELEGLDLEKWTQYEKNFEEDSELRKVTKQLFDTRLFNMVEGKPYHMIYGTKFLRGPGEVVNTLVVSCAYELDNEDYEVGIMYIDAPEELQSWFSQARQLYEDNHIEGNWYYLCRYLASTKDTWRK